MRVKMDYKNILSTASNTIVSLNGREIPVVDITRPESIEYARQLAKVISKLSPLLGNMIEFSTVDILNSLEWGDLGSWIRQDPGFPDATFKSDIVMPNPGIEIKTWFPLATEITARFKDSVSHFKDDQINVALIAWLPEFLIWGKPVIIDAWVGSASGVAEARDLHYHRPPDYLVIEPEDTKDRTANLQQTNTNGYKFQGGQEQLLEAKSILKAWGENACDYSTTKEYQEKLRSLMGMFPYRLDTNFAKMDRIEHPSLEQFKTKVLETDYLGQTIRNWSRILGSSNDLLDKELLRLINMGQ